MDSWEEKPREDIQTLKEYVLRSHKIGSQKGKNNRKYQQETFSILIKFF